MSSPKRVTVLGDWKSSTFKSVEFRLQLGGYYGATHLYHKATKQWSLKAPVDAGMIVHCNEGGVYPLLVMTQAELEEAFVEFQHALKVYRYLATWGKLSSPERYAIEGTQYVSVTEVLNHVCAKPGLLQWYAKMAKQGKDPNEIRDAKGAIGNTIHKALLFYLRGDAVDVGEAPAYLTKTLAHFAVWSRKIKLEPVHLEATVVHQALGYAGTLDCTWTCDASAIEPKEVLTHATTG